MASSSCPAVPILNSGIFPVSTVIYLNLMLRHCFGRSKKNDPLLGDGQQKKPTYGACDPRGGVVDVEACIARGL